MKWKSAAVEELTAPYEVKGPRLLAYTFWDQFMAIDPVERDTSLAVSTPSDTQPLPPNPLSTFLSAISHIYPTVAHRP